MPPSNKRRRSSRLEISVEDAYRLVKDGKCKELLERLGTPCTNYLAFDEDTSIYHAHAKFAKPGMDLGANEDFWLEAACYSSPSSGWTFAHQVLCMATGNDGTRTEYCSSFGDHTKSALRVIQYLLTAHVKLGRTHEDMLNLVTSTNLKLKDVEPRVEGGSVVHSAVTKYYKGWPNIRGVEYLVLRRLCA